MENAVFWDVMPCGSCKNRYFRGTYRLHHQAATVEIRSSEMSVLARATCHISEDGILQFMTYYYKPAVSDIFLTNTALAHDKQFDAQRNNFRKKAYA
jgi:hypothetical protein